ncbi:hypothetical protein O181_017625 [Austropuccinia psidii MF-1]|uniref:Uncharacterized protein n=1 Tax=Austropuccinia psidii MF-1 TaxID=1389203 RepID=A0A9Q3GT75_9BASI|nr:hypothetical protein [Austropuccinia psidii MF-1]
MDATTGAPCVGIIRIHTNSSTSLTLIRDGRWAFYTENSHSQYFLTPSRSFSLVARDLCRIVFASPIWRKTCYNTKDEAANLKCLQTAKVLAIRASLEPMKTIEVWNRAFDYFGEPRNSHDTVGFS